MLCVVRKNMDKLIPNCITNHFFVFQRGTYPDIGSTYQAKMMCPVCLTHTFQRPIGLQYYPGLAAVCIPGA